MASRLDLRSSTRASVETRAPLFSAKSRYVNLSGRQRAGRPMPSNLSPHHAQSVRGSRAQIGKDQPRFAFLQGSCCLSWNPVSRSSLVSHPAPVARPRTLAASPPPFLCFRCTLQTASCWPSSARLSLTAHSIHSVRAYRHTANAALMHRELRFLVRPDLVGFRPRCQERRITMIHRSQKRRFGERSLLHPDFAFLLHWRVRHGRSKSCVFAFLSPLSTVDGHCLRGQLAVVRI